MSTTEAPAPFAHYDREPLLDSTIERYDLADNRQFIIPTDNPFTTEIISVKGQDETISVLARVTAETEENTRLVLAKREGSEELFVAQERPYGGKPILDEISVLGTEEVKEKPQLRQSRATLGKRDFEVSYAPKSHLASIKLVGVGTLANPATGEAHIQFATQNPDEQQANKDVFKFVEAGTAVTEASEKTKRVRRRIAGVTLGILGMTAPHSLVDQGIDAFASQKAVVTDIVDDGEYGPDRREAFERIELIVSDIDDGNEQAIQERADNYVEAHAGDFTTEQETQELLESLNTVESLEDLDATMSNFLEGYGITFSTSEHDQYARPLEGDDVSEAVEYAREIIETTALFPKSTFTDLFRLHRIVLTHGIDAGERKIPAAGWNTGEGVIYLDAENSMRSDLMRPAGAYSHELSHSLQYDEFELAKEAGGFTSLPLDTLAGILRYDKEPSLYGAIGDLESHSDATDEFRAEVGSDLLTDGIINPNESLRFESPISEARVKLLSTIEAKLPGFSDYLASKTILSQETTNYQRLGGKTRTALTALLTAVYFSNRRLSDRVRVRPQSRLE